MLFQFLLCSKVNQLYMQPLFWISFPFMSPQSTEQSSLCYAVGCHQLSILYRVVYTCQSQSSNSSHCQLKKYTHNLKVESYFIWWEFLALQVWETTLRAAEKLLQGGGGRSQLLGPVLIYHLVYKLLFYSSGEKRRKTENQMRSHSSTREVLSMWSGPAGSGSWGLVRNADLPAPPLTS